MATLPAGPAEPRYGWLMVAVAFLGLGLNFGSLITISIFLKPLSADFGWLRGETAFAYTSGVAAVGVCGILWGWLADRYGTRPVVLFGAVMQGLAIWLLSRLGALWQLYLCYILLGGLGFAAMNVPLITNVGQWFTRRKGLALGIVSAGGALGQGLVPFLARWLITQSDWRTAYFQLALLLWFAGVPLMLLVRTPPRMAAARAAGPMGAALPDDEPFVVEPRVAVTWLSVAVIFCCICMAVPLVHLVALATDEGVAPQMAAGLFTALMMAGLFGRLLIGRLADIVGGLRAYLLASFAQTVLVFWFTQVQSLAGLFLLSVLFGLGYSGVMTCIWLCVREMVPPGVAGRSLGIVVLFAWLGMGLGGWQGGVFYDLTGSYTAPFAIAALAGVVNLAILLSLHRYTGRRQLAMAGAAA